MQTKRERGREGEGEIGRKRMIAPLIDDPTIPVD